MANTNPTCQIPTPRSLAELLAMESAHVAHSAARVAPRVRESASPLAKGGQGKEEEEEEGKGGQKVVTDVQKSRMRARSWARERKAKRKS